MDFSFTSEQDMLRDTVARLVREQYDFDTRRKVAKSESGWRPQMWAQFAELALQRLTLDGLAGAESLYPGAAGDGGQALRVAEISQRNLGKTLRLAI